MAGNPALLSMLSPSPRGHRRDRHRRDLARSTGSLCRSSSPFSSPAANLLQKLETIANSSPSFDQAFANSRPKIWSTATQSVAIDLEAIAKSSPKNWNTKTQLAPLTSDHLEAISNDLEATAKLSPQNLKQQELEHQDPLCGDREAFANSSHKNWNAKTQSSSTSSSTEHGKWMESKETTASESSCSTSASECGASDTFCDLVENEASQPPPASLKNPTGCESSCSTSAWESGASDTSCDFSENDASSCDCARFVCPTDVDALLATLSEDQKARLDRSSFQQECQRIFRIMDTDENGFLCPSELEHVIAHLIPQPHKPISTEDGKCLMLSIQSVLKLFDKDADRQLSAEEFPDFVGFCAAWRSQQERMMATQASSDEVSPGTHGGFVANIGVRPASEPCGAAHRLAHSASMGRIGHLVPVPLGLPPKLPGSMTGSFSASALRPGTSSRRASLTGTSSSRIVPESSRPSTGTCTALIVPESRRPSTLSSRNTSKSSVRSSSGSRRPSKSVAFQSNASSRQNSPQPAPGSKATRENLGTRQMRALKSLLTELAGANKSVKDLVRALMHNIMSPDSTQAFTKETVGNVCELALQAARTGTIATNSAIAAFMQDLGHCAADCAEENAEFVVDRAVEVVVLLSLRWFAMRYHMDVPDMSDYAKQSWLPPAFCHLVGQILWRHRAAESMQCGHMSVVENLRWITLVPDAPEDMVDECNVVFQLLGGSQGGHMKLRQWRKVVELIATNPELRLRIRRCDAVRACYGEAVAQSESCLSRKNFKLMLMKTADLMGVHPVTLVKEVAGHAEALQASQKAQKDAEL